MPKELKLFLMACFAVPLLLLTTFLFLWYSASADISSDLELNRFKMKISIQENQSGLREEQTYLKATLTPEEAIKLSRWLQHYQRPGNSHQFYLPDKLEGKPGWQPDTIKRATRGSFFLKGSYHWRCSYLIAPINKNTSVFYLYGIDLLYEEDPPASRQ